MTLRVEAEVPDFNELLRQYVLHEAAKELYTR